MDTVQGAECDLPDPEEANCVEPSKFPHLISVSFTLLTAMRTIRRKKIKSFTIKFLDLTFIQ